MEPVVTPEFLATLPSTLPAMAAIAKERQVRIACERVATIKRVRRRFDTEEARQFWASVEESAREVETWPEWKRSLARIAIDGGDR